MEELVRNAHREAEMENVTEMLKSMEAKRKRFQK